MAERIEAGLKAAAAKALDEHRRAGRLVPVWQDGKVIEVVPPSPEEFDALVLRDKPPGWEKRS